MKNIILIATSLVLLVGCSPSSHNDMSFKKMKVDYVTVAEHHGSNVSGKRSDGQKTVYLTYDDHTTTYHSGRNIRVFIESNDQWLRITQVRKRKPVGKKTDVILYKPDALISYSTGDYTFTCRANRQNLNMSNPQVEAIVKTLIDSSGAQ